MTYAFDEAIAELAKRSTLAELIDLVQKTSAQVAGAPADATSILYSGTVNGQSAVDISKALVRDTVGESGTNRFVRVDETPLGKLLFDPRFDEKLKIAVRADLASKVPGFDSLSDAEKSSLVTEAQDRIYANKSHGTRLPVDPANPSLWDIASKSFVEQATGNFRVVAAGVSDTSVLIQTELPALLSRGGNPLIDGIELAHIKTVGDISAGINELLAQAQVHTYLSHLSPTNLRAYKTFTPDDIVKTLSLADNLGAFEALVNEMPSAQQTRFLAGVKAMQDANAVLAKSSAVKGLTKLGLVAGVLSFVLAGRASAAEYASGNTDKSKAIMVQWSVDFAGSLAGGAIAGAVTGIAVGAAAAAGVVIAAPVAGALILGATLVGGYFGAEGAAEFWKMLDDRDNDGKRDIFNKLDNLLLGAHSTITTPLPADLNGGKFTIDASLSRDEIVSQAKVSIAWRYALRELNSFVITDVSYDRHNTDGSLDLYDPVTGKGEMTERFLQDRGAMLAWKLRWEDRSIHDDNGLIPRGGRKPYDQAWVTSSIQGNWDYVDLANRLPGGAPLTLAIDGAGLSLSDHQIVFGSAKGDVINGAGAEDFLYGMAGDDKINGGAARDYLEGDGGADDLDGGTGNDTLVGGSGNDKLAGGAGDDKLDGGAGADTYVVAAMAGFDTVLSSDSTDKLEYAGRILTGAGEMQAPEGLLKVWLDKSNPAQILKYTYYADRSELTVSGAGSAVLIQDFQNGDLGITIPGAVPTPPPPTSVATIDLTGQKGSGSGQSYWDGSSFKTTAIGANEHFTNVNRLASSLTAPAHIVAKVVGRGGDDWMEGGVDDPANPIYVTGGGGDDRIYAHTTQTLSEALATQATAVASGQSNLLLDGGAGNDSVFGSAGDDALFGGAGDDTLVGGAGRDVIYSDGDAGRSLKRDVDVRWVAGANDPLNYNTLYFNGAPRLGIIYKGGESSAISKYSYEQFGFDALGSTDYSGLASLRNVAVPDDPDYADARFYGEGGYNSFTEEADVAVPWLGTPAATHIGQDHRRQMEKIICGGCGVYMGNRMMQPSELNYRIR